MILRKLLPLLTIAIIITAIGYGYLSSKSDSPSAEHTGLSTLN